MKNLGVFAIALIGCTKPAPSVSDAGPVASSAPSATASSAIVTAACSFDHGFHGTLSPNLEIYMRLERRGDTLEGRYFYAKVGSDLALTGAVTNDTFHLSEGATGEFDGKCEKDGHLRGTWNKPGDAERRSFDLERIGPRTTVLVATKSKVRKFPPKKSDAGGPTGGFAFEKNESCIESISWPEVFGAPSAAVETALNAKLVSHKWVLDAASAKDLEACVAGDRVKANRIFDVLMNDASVLAIRSHETINYEGGTHPWDPGAESWLTFDTQTGTKLERKLLLDESKPALAKLVAEVAKTCAGGDEKISLTNRELLLAPTPKGLEIAATGYPPPARVFEGNGPTITWSALVATGGLKDSAVSRYAAKAPADTAKCLKRNGE